MFTRLFFRNSASQLSGFTHRAGILASRAVSAPDVLKNQKSGLHKWSSPRETPEVEVCIGGIPMAGMTLFAKNRHPIDSHKRIIYIDSPNWLTRMDPRHYNNKWGQTYACLHATLLRHLFNQSVMQGSNGSNFSVNSYLKWGHIKILKEKLAEELESKKDVEVIKKEVVKIIPVQENQGLCIVFADGANIQIPMNSSHIYNFAQRSREPMLPCLPGDTPVKAIDHTQIYSVAHSDLPKEIGILGAGPSMLWMAENIKHSKIYLFILENDQINFTPRNDQVEFYEQVQSGRIQIVRMGKDLKFASLDNGNVEVFGLDADGNEVQLILPNIYSCTGMVPVTELTEAVPAANCTELSAEVSSLRNSGARHHSVASLPSGNMQDLFNTGLSLTGNVASPFYLAHYVAGEGSFKDCHIDFYLNLIQKNFLPDLCIDTAKDVLQRKINSFIEYPSDQIVLEEFWCEMMRQSSVLYASSNEIASVVDMYLISTHQALQGLEGPRESSVLRL